MSKLKHFCEWKDSHTRFSCEFEKGLQIQRFLKSIFDINLFWGRFKFPEMPRNRNRELERKKAKYDRGKQTNEIYQILFFNDDPVEQ